MLKVVMVDVTAVDCKFNYFSVNRDREFRGRKMIFDTQKNMQWRVRLAKLWVKERHTAALQSKPVYIGPRGLKHTSIP